jgi:hypothetical protein
MLAQHSFDFSTPMFGDDIMQFCYDYVLRLNNIAMQ